ncbi:MAG: tetratricopeptide repeat protein [Candidatus Riflebacteria bacterium]|nr:tetratricopeptide repeat protein [Candidatus Riflebacteria bacterium]
MIRRTIRILFFISLLLTISSFYNKNMAVDGNITGVDVVDRERMLHRLKLIRMKRPGDHLTTYKIANIYYSLQMEDEAIKEYRRCLREKPDFPHAKWFLSKVLESKGYFDEAFKLARELLEEFPENYRYYYRAGEILVRLEKPAIAKEYFKRCDDLIFKN